jgi:hypothetical protein
VFCDRDHPGWSSHRFYGADTARRAEARRLRGGCTGSCRLVPWLPQSLRPGNERIAPC